MRVLALLVCLAISAPATRAAELPVDCAFNLADVPDAPRFEDYPSRPVHIAAPARPRLTSPLALQFRTMIRRGAADGPNFAGGYTVVGWGCGASCTWYAIVDARTGRVFTDDRISDVFTGHVADEPSGPEPPWFGLRYRPDSRLLAIVGAADEDEAHEGVSFYEWTGAALRPVRFVPRAAICKRDPLSPATGSP